MSSFYIVLIVGIFHLVLCGGSLIYYRNDSSPKAEGIKWASLFGVGMAFVYFLSALTLIK